MTGAASSLWVTSSAASAQRRDDGYSRNEFGLARTVSSAGFIDHSNPFFQSLGTNGRSCASCHVQDQGWAISADDVQRRFNQTNGRDPIFALVDGANSPNAKVSNLDDRRKAFSMLRTKGVIRVERPIPANAEFELVRVDDPYHYASAAGLSLFRRPLPSTNLGCISTVMWDGREVDPTNPMKIANAPDVNRAILEASLAHQALDATTGHAQGAGLSPEQQQQIVDFELGLATAQVKDVCAGWLNEKGAQGGPDYIPTFPFYIGINDNVGDPKGPFNPDAMTLYDSWNGARDDGRASIARGEKLFNSKPITISGVAGLNDNPYFGSPKSFVGTCTSCHNTPNIGNHSLAIALNIGIADGSRRTPDMPLYTLRNLTTGQKVTTTDPGLALSTGKWSDIGRFKGPVLRGLAARAPYFHNGSAKDLDAVLDFYRDRFGVFFTRRERADLIAFLRSL
ncbi:MAG TPA: hypothetical protein VG944_15890 [Fimbriimonas sp.]|nr:hypothetical protein [Fimbriimonas sp.]